MNTKIVTSFVAAALVLCTGVSGGVHAADFQAREMHGESMQLQRHAPAGAKPARPNSIYIVQLTGSPVIAYEGDVAGYEATKPGEGEKLDAESAHVKRYAAHLEERQNQMIHRAGGSKVYSYRYAFNGFAARMTDANAEALRADPGVVNVWKDEIRRMQTDSSPSYIGLTSRGGAWLKGLTGRNIVVGVIDSGIWPEHPSFDDNDRKGHHRWRGYHPLKRPYGPIPGGFTPSGCDFGNMAANALDAEFSCNKKLIAARCYNTGFSTGPDESNPCGGNGAFTGPHEFQSARDVDGHGSHTAATAAGNFGVAAEIDGEFLGKVSGVAPRARIAAYKVCWDGPDMTTITDDGCASSDSAAAIDQAVIDGVDVINFSVGGSSTVFAGADDIAFLFAADAGVHVATSNGNTGPGPETTGTPAGVPWLTSVGATQDDGVFNLAITANAPASVAGDYVALEGAGDVSLADAGVINADLTLASTITACDVDGPNDAISGIALVSRGVCSFTEKYNNVAAAGASAIVVFNDGADSTRIDPIVMTAPGTSIPGVMISYTDGIALAGESGVHATMDPDNQVSAENRIAGFSSRGPNGGAPDIIKPDVSAPGVDILAAESGANGQLFQSISGTSMASPHVAGSFALIKQARPDWTPAQARSALMTTARQDLKKTFGDNDATPFDIGAGEIQPSDAINPGLTYDAGFFDYLAFTCDNNVQLVSDGTCADLEAAGFPSDGSELNLPSIGIAELVGAQTVTRTVTSVARGKGKKTFRASVDAPPGIDVSVSPSVLRLRRGESATYEVTISAKDDAAMEQWAFGSLTWGSGKKRGHGWGWGWNAHKKNRYSVRSPIAVYPKAFLTAEEVDGSGASGSGSVDVPVTFGYDGAYNANVFGLQASFAGASNVSVDVPVRAFCVNLPANTHFRAAMFDAETSVPGADDLDLEVFYLPNGCGDFTGVAFQGGSYTPTTAETVDVPDGPAGGYHVQVYYFAAANGTDSDFRIWFQPVFGDNANTTVNAPASAVLGNSDTVSVGYGGLFTGTRYLGVLQHADDHGEIARTILDIDTR